MDFSGAVDADVANFFAEFARENDDPDSLDQFFDPQFLSLDPRGSHVVSLDQLRAVLPARAEMFRSIGVTKTELSELTDNPLDEDHVLATTTWTARDDEGVEVLTLSSTYLLRRTEGGWRIAVYLNHADIGRTIAERRAA